MSKNANCLEGYSCPNCGQNEGFRIVGTAEFLIVDDGAEDHGDIYWEASAHIQCPDCKQEGKVIEFCPDFCSQVVGEKPAGATIQTKTVWVLYDFDVGDLLPVTYPSYKDAVPDADQLDNIVILPLEVPGG